MYGEGNWKADEEYRQGVKEFAATHDVPKLAREAADSLDDEEEEVEEDDEEEAPPAASDETEW